MLVIAYSLNRKHLEKGDIKIHQLDKQNPFHPGKRTLKSVT